MSGVSPTPLHVVAFGTFDESMHPRIRVLIEAAQAAGHRVTVLNRPLRVTTAERVRAVRRPWRAVALLARMVRCWTGLVRDARGLDRSSVDVVLVGYLGVMDIHLARLCFRAPAVLDHMAPLRGIAQDRDLPFGRVLGALEDLAESRAAVILTDTEASRLRLGDRVRDRAAVVPVGAAASWFAPKRDSTDRPESERPIRVCFFGLFTPLQGTQVIAGAIEALRNRTDITWTLIGTGQDYDLVHERLRDAPSVRWLPWVESSALPATVAAHDICLGIFGTTPKASRVVPNKVYQGAAAGCAVVTSDTPPQREALGDAAVFVDAGDAPALAAAIDRLATDRAALDELGRAARHRADSHFSAPALAVRLDGELRRAAASTGT